MLKISTRLWMACAIAAVAATVAIGQNSSKKGTSKVEQRPYGTMPDGAPIEMYTLSNANGMRAEIITYGGAVVSLTAPDKAGKYEDVVYGMENIAGYTGDPKPPFFGALIGRYGNRIGHGQFTLEGKTYNLLKNDGDNTLHGGPEGFDKRVWKGRPLNGKEQAVELTYTAKDGEEGFPGNLTARVVYTLTDKNELKIEYTATTDKPTVVNLTNHSYFNLACDGTILDHQVTINADRFTPVDKGLIPTGELRPVKGTPFDFTKPTRIGARINDKDEQLEYGRGYDHNWVLNRTGAGSIKAAEVYEPKSGRVMEVWTTEPGLQFYTGNFLDGTIHGKGGKVYPHRGAFCMETQHYPDSPNHPSFPSTELKPGQTYRTTTIYRFSAR